MPMTKEVRAVVLGVFVVVLVALALSFWRRPAAEFRRIKEFRVEFVERDGDATRRGSFRIPSGILAGAAKLAPFAEMKGDLSAEWGRGDVTPRDILDAADQSTPGSPGVIVKDDAKIEVLADGSVLEIDIKDDWDKHVHVRLPRVIVEGFADDATLSTSDILRSLDELGPGDVVRVQDGDSEVTITAVPRKSAIVID
jgi:hypothetical protein